MKRQRKTFARPTKRWDKARIDEEAKLLRDYGLKNKRELWKAKGVISKFRARARKLFGEETGREELFGKLLKLGISKKEATLDDVLGLTVEAILERRLQTLVLRKGLGQTPIQARQLITHRHIMLGGRVVDVPGYIVTVEEEKTIKYSSSSPVNDKDHPLHAAPKVVKEEGKKPEGKGVEAPKPEPKSKEEKKPEPKKEAEPPKDDITEEKKRVEAPESIEPPKEEKKEEPKKSEEKEVKGEENG
jgi:small subunit ribosomal protein S4